MIKRAVSVDEIMKKKFKDMKFEGTWENSFGHPETSGVWLIWGASGNGKTTFALMVAMHLNRYARVAYNSLEEGVSKSLQIAMGRVDLLNCKQVIIISEDMAELRKRLDCHKSPQVIIIDSFQYTGLTKNEYKQLKRDYPTKLFIFISHSEGSQPEGRTAKFVKYDADVKVHIEGYKAFVVSRYGGGAPFVVWREGAAQYWNEIK